MRVLQKNIIILHLLVDSTEHCIKAEKPKKCAIACAVTILLLNFAIRIMRKSYEEIDKHNTLRHTLLNDCVDRFGHHDRGVRAYGSCVCCPSNLKKALQRCRCQPLHEAANENPVAHRHGANRLSSFAARVAFSASAADNEL